MTLGEKIRDARRKYGLSQEQLAEKMSVSRSAIAKWETDKGLPDVGNLKILARLLSVSVDRLLDEAEATDEAMIREFYNLAAYGRGCKKVKKDRVVRDKFPDAKIYSLFGRQELMDLELFADSAPDCRTSPQDLIKNADKAFYLIEKEDRQFFVTVTDTFVEIRPLEQPLQSNSFTIDGWNFIKCNYEIGI
ncbi:MAG: helix-turn-helix domain-containing protein [Oscillospiraceae bacterium]|nr:helix-turn-helix domain-containing protein [Oscillospiraceae bacterium]MBQ8880738.1 helix-turn-helix domain-containing protein [Oscillospiraceae bacterium]